ncbi:probable pectinesterase 29 [Pistacia vera]|uniref:probable pectinesterase 29 n=1 Tax=Pistacia vera TaxID=55513 RepID=UPI001262C460|nr:probable pectinesterase 29 [Pistacia vera]
MTWHLALAVADSMIYKIPENKAASNCEITVDQSGHGSFSSIQSAINAIPSNNSRWICISIKAGIYREKVKIPYDRPYIILKGEGQRTTHVIWGDHQSVAESPTFTSAADNVVVKEINFVNSYNSPNGRNKNPRTPAVAAMIAGDKNSFYQCGFSGVQDTLWDDQGRHYFDHCTIEGAVDFIFGTGQSIYQSCVIHVLGEALETGFSGYITAQGRTNPNDANGFVFKNCRVYGTGSALLGRAWRGYARVIFYDSELRQVVSPEGWNAWNFRGHENQLTFVEYGCYGKGADTSGRVKWVKYSLENMRELVSINFIDNEGWLRKQPS